MKLYFKYVSMILKCQMQYKASFIMTTIGQFLVSFTTFIGVYFMFSRFNTVDGFTFSEVLLCFSVVLMAFSLTECFVRGFDVFPRLIKSGDLDRILVRPRNEIFQVLTSNIDFSRFGRLFQAVLMLCYAIPTSGIAWNLSKVMTLIIMLIGGIAVFSALFVLYAGISFFTIEGLEFMNIFTDGSREFGKYPLSIYGEGVLRFLTYVVPIALFQYYPFLYLIGRSNNIGLIFLPFIGFLFLIPCYIFFKFGVRKYKSTGS
ncbi:MAG: ABC-2 family transporter protein [Oscillospiraceae bacterium]|nr:ABC-2 family transporter protein [Oscillospiraceae bacterium]